VAYDARVLKDSLSPSGARLTTLEVTFPRIVLAEFNTHRVFSRNSASSRAIPVEKMLKRVMDDPFIPIHWGKNQKGMQANEEVTLEQTTVAMTEWLKARDFAVQQAKELLYVGIHKQITNRLLEPFLWQTVIITATEFGNWNALRRHPDAQPEIKRVADMMWDARAASTPIKLDHGEWHLPLTPEIDELLARRRTGDVEAIDWEFWKKVSTGRCARVSYLTHDGRRDLEADIGLCERLQASGHMSPFEHVARPLDDDDLAPHETFPNLIFRGNFRGWLQYRKQLPFEDDYASTLASIEDANHHEYAS
jgi:hypothetical protein